jgi:Ran GTPase-activating protein (RanGAP) involved in mRNA processing and transport
MDLSGERAPVWGKEGIEALCATRVFGQLTSLSLNERGLTPEQLNMVLHALPDDQLKELWLTDNALGDEGVARLLECRKLQSLNILKLDKNNITPKGVQMLDDAAHGLNALVREFVGQDLKDELGLDAL